MTDLQIVTKAKFGNKSWKHCQDYFFSAQDMVCKLSTVELPQAMMAMPLAFFPTDVGYSVVGVQGLQAGINSFVNEYGKWRGSYVPAAYRGYPFVLADNESNNGDLALSFDNDSGLLIDDDSEEPFFGDDFEPSEPVGKIVEYLYLVNVAEQKSLRICKMLAEHGLLKPWELTFKLENENKGVDGLFCIDETILNELSDDSYSELRAAGAIPVIYCQLLSMQRILDLTEPRSRAPAAPVPWFLQTKLETGSLVEPNELYSGEGDADGNISFENL